MSKTHAVLLALGSNIEREKKMPLAISLLAEHPEINLCAVSPIYECLPVGGKPNQPLFSNAAVAIETSLDPARLKAVLRQIEKEMGRVRTADKYAPRPIDIDIALYRQQILELDGNPIPEPDVLRFPHLLLPLADVAGEWQHPEVGKPLRQLAASLEYNSTEIYQI